MSSEVKSGFIYGLQAASWKSGEILEPGLTKIGSTSRTVAERVAEMRRSLGAGGGHRLVVAFAVPVADLRVERAVHAVLKADGKHLPAGSAAEWFSVSPADAHAMVSAFASGTSSVDDALAILQSAARPTRNRASIRGPKEIKMTPVRAAALEAVRTAARNGGSPSDFAGGRWGAAATALAVEEGISKTAALILMTEWFAALPTASGSRVGLDLA